MERVLTFISTASNSRKQITSNATTLRELKAECRANGINYEGMSFMEGISHTILADDDAQLPTNVKYKDTTTNNLVIMLTNNSKRIKSGTMSRTEMYAFIREKGIAKDIAKKYEKNFTQCSDAELESFISTYNTVSEGSDNQSNLKEAIRILIDALYDDDLISGTTHERVSGCLEQENIVNPVYSTEELADICNRVGNEFDY